MKFDQPQLLWLLAFALLPLVARPGAAVANAWVAFAPRDRASALVDGALRGAAALALAALVAALAGPYRPEVEVERVGKGAEIVLVLDRSRSMDQGFANARPAGTKRTGPEAIDFYMSQSPGRLRDSKGKVARQLLAEFAAKRPLDRFGMIVFSTLPIRILDFTQKRDAVEAAIAAGNIGRGLSETNIGLALLAALASFDDRPYTGSRIVMLVSDGGDRLDPDAAERIDYLMRKHRVALYWIYLRSANSPGLAPEPGATPEPASNDATSAEVALHRFFQSIDAPYQAYEADNPQALRQAIDAVDRLENLPIVYRDTVPRRDLSTPCYGVAFACAGLLLAASLMEVRRWA